MQAEKGIALLSPGAQLPVAVALQLYREILLSYILLSYIHIHIYMQAEKGIALLSPGAQLPVAVALQLYREILFSYILLSYIHIHIYMQAEKGSLATLYCSPHSKPGQDNPLADDTHADPVHEH